MPEALPLLLPLFPFSFFPLHLSSSRSTSLQCRPRRCCHPPPRPLCTAVGRSDLARLIKPSPRRSAYQGPLAHRWPRECGEHTISPGRARARKRDSFDSRTTSQPPRLSSRFDPVQDTTAPRPDAASLPRTYSSTTISRIVLGRRQALARFQGPRSPLYRPWTTSRDTPKKSPPGPQGWARLDGSVGDCTGLCIVQYL